MSTKIPGDPLFHTLLDFRKTSSISEVITEFYEDIDSMKELQSLIVGELKLNIYCDMINSYNFLPQRVSKDERRNFVLGMNYFHISEHFEQDGFEMPIYTAEDLDTLIKNRTDDLEYMLGDYYPSLMDEFTKMGIEKEAKSYYKNYK